MQRLAPEYDRFATAMKGKVRVGAVDCTQHQATCSEFNVRAPAEKGQHRSLEDMHADRTLQLQLVSDGKPS